MSNPHAEVAPILTDTRYACRDCECYPLGARSYGCAWRGNTVYPDTSVCLSRGAKLRKPVGAGGEE